MRLLRFITYFLATFIPTTGVGVIFLFTGADEVAAHAATAILTAALILVLAPKTSISRWWALTVFFPILIWYPVVLISWGLSSRKR